MALNNVRAWTPIVIVFLAGSIATSLVPLMVPILGPISSEFGIAGAQLGWIVSFPTLICAIGALAFGVVVDRMGDVRVLLAGMALVILGDAGVIIAHDSYWLFAARLFQGGGYVCLSVAGPSFIQRTTTGEMRRAAMAFWAAHTPLGFAVTVFVGAQLVAAGTSWRLSFVAHAAAALAIGAAVLLLRRAQSAADVRRSAGTLQVVTSAKPYAVAIGAAGTAMLQVSVMVMLPAMMGGRFALSGPESALVVVTAMIANWCGAMVIVATAVRKIPRIALPVTALASALLATVIVAEATDGIAATMAVILAFGAAIGAANSLVWSLLPAAVPSPEASGATAGLITQGSFLGVFVGPPAFFWLRHESPMLLFALILLLVLPMVVALVATRSAQRAE